MPRHAANVMNKGTVNTVIYVLIACMVFINFFIYSHIFTDKIPEAHYASSDAADRENTAAPDSDAERPSAAVSADTLPPDYKYITANVSDTRSGTLILVNNTHPYTFDNQPSVVEPEANSSIYYSKTASYSVRDINVSMNTAAIQALNQMMDDFYAYQGNKKTIIINQGLRTYEEQQTILDEKIAALGENQTIAQKPGNSEHHTGYAMDISLYENNIMATFTGEGAYSWIFENAHKYGFILRYPEGKESVTGISYESWHFRYVGVPHAEYMYQNQLTLEEYIDKLALYPFESAHLGVTDSATGAAYEIYSVPVSVDGTRVPVPSVADGLTEYSMSGDNSGHVIVTVKTGVQ